jgi:ATP phosphoribosyltransferase regulatory subunit
MDYYTGITFRGVAPGLGWPVISGGRYDDLVAGFGRPLAAVGFGLGLERALLVQARQGVPYPAIAPHVLVQRCDHAACLALVLKLRQRGLRVEVEPLGLAGRELAEQARLRGIPRTLSCASGQWQLAEATRLPGYERVLHEADILQEAEGWVS